MGGREVARVVVEGVELGPDEEGVGWVGGADGVAGLDVSFFRIRGEEWGWRKGKSVDSEEN